MDAHSRFVITVSPSGFGMVEGSYALVRTAGSWLAGSNIVSELRDSGAIGAAAAVTIIARARKAAAS